MYVQNHLTFGLSAHQETVIADLDALLSVLPEGTVDESRPGVSLAPPGQQHPAIPEQPDSRTIVYTLVPSAPDAATSEVTIGAESPDAFVGVSRSFYWEINNKTEFPSPWLTSVVPLCQSIMAGGLREVARYRGTREVSLFSQLDVPGLECPCVSGWSLMWTYLMIWLGPIRAEARQYGPWV
jgi:hypothetical protein